MQSEKDQRPELKELQERLASGEGLRPFLDEVHAADLATWFSELEQDEQDRLVRALDDEERAAVLRFAEDPEREEILARMSVPQIVQVVQDLPADEVVDLLALTDDATTDQVLRSVDLERARGLRALASYDAETAGGLMTSEFVTVPQDASVGDAIKLIRKEKGPAGDEEGGIFVVDPRNRPVGFVSDRELLTTPIHTPVREVMDEDVITASVDADQEEVAQLVRKYSLSAVPVVDASGALLGVVSEEDALDVLQDEAEEDILKLVGTSSDDQTRLSVLLRVRARLPLQALTVLGGLATAWILDLALGAAGVGSGGATGDVLRYLPIVLGLAGNVGIQSSTILVRAFATGELSQEREASVLGSEVLTGLMIGLCCGLTTLVVAALLESSLDFGCAVGGAITVAVSWASFLGCLVPMSCRRLGIDPAIAAGPFLITLSDISGASIFMGVAHLALDIGS